MAMAMSSAPASIREQQEATAPNCALQRLRAVTWRRLSKIAHRVRGNLPGAKWVNSSFDFGLLVQHGVQQ
jgi:hypothetical protein